MDIPYKKILLTLVIGIFSVIFYFGLTLDFNINKSASKNTFDIEEIKLFYDDSSKFTLLKNAKMFKEKNWILFFSPNCSYCKDQIKLISGLQDRLIKSNISLILVSTLDQKTTGTYLEEYDISKSSDLYYTTEAILNESIQDFSYPYTVILDKDHNLIINHKGVFGFNEVKKLL